MEAGGRGRDERALGVEGQEVGRLIERDPAHPLELVIVEREIPADRLHQPVMHGLVDPDAALDEDVGNRGQRLEDPDPEARFLLDLPDRRLLDRLTRIGGSLGECPRAPPSIALAASQPGNQGRSPAE